MDLGLWTIVGTVLALTIGFLFGNALTAHLEPRFGWALLILFLLISLGAGENLTVQHWGLMYMVNMIIGAAYGHFMRRRKQDR